MATGETTISGTHKSKEFASPKDGVGRLCVSKGCCQRGIKDRPYRNFDFLSHASKLYF
jgi:hypothetical protein